ncbi:MAG TPA: iron ABC transporter permease [Methanosarcinaceae archaeon]|nr:iron ABC transporter permease [Methanosarcinaceae archaeon]
MNGDTFKDKSTAIVFSNQTKIIFIIALLVSLIVVIAITITRGAYNVPIIAVYEVILDNLNLADQSNRLYDTIVWNIRVPRILLAIAVGIALGTSGAVYQGTFRNPLVEPFILGVSAGAAFGAALSIVYPQYLFSVQISACIFGMVAVFGAYSLARVRGETPLVTLILAGVILGSIFMSGVSILKYISADTQLREIVFWMMGGFYYADWDIVWKVVPAIIICSIVLCLLGWRLNVLSMGEEEAKMLGINTERTKIILITLATFVTAISVSAVGIIAWVGLMMPHAARLVIGPDHRFLIPSAAIMGAIFLVICDTLARTLTTAEVPVGIITSLLGAPYLIYLLRTKKNIFFG